MSAPDNVAAERANEFWAGRALAYAEEIETLKKRLHEVGHEAQSKGHERDNARGHVARLKAGLEWMLEGSWTAGTLRGKARELLEDRS